MADLIARRDALLGAGAPLFYEEPLTIVRGEGVHLFDEDGRRFVDMYNNVPCVGHAHPRVVEAMARAVELMHEAGVLFIADEVQAGFCRTGHWWGYERMGFVPDIVTMGKPIGNGMPICGAVASKDLVDTFRRRSRYFNTFASSPLQAAAGSAVLDVIESEDCAGTSSRRAPISVAVWKPSRRPASRWPRFVATGCLPRGFEARRELRPAPPPARLPRPAS